ANSEGEPGPMDYGRNHADGANMLADALDKGFEASKHSANTPKPIVMWRAFVYSPKGTDRASQAYDEFMPLDGQFRENVIIQVKNGPIDFQPREPVSPLFFSMQKTPVMPEFQITQEYTGESIHTCFLVSMWKEFFDTVKGYANVKKYDAVAGVANVGDMKDWCGSDMTQVNWYAFGRMAWNDAIAPQQIADEWLKMTYTTNKAFVEPMTDVLMESREAVVRYMMPLGLHHIFAGGHHYGPEPWCDPRGWREDWKPKYYHKADKAGLGFDRTLAGSQNVRQYPDALFNIYNKVETCPEQFLLWFHHVPWTHKMHNGETLWEALCHTYDQGVRQAEAFARVWEQMKPYVDVERYEAQKLNFDRQAKDAWWWRDACLLYFQQFSGMKLPLDCPAPKYKFEDLQKYNLPIDNYTRAPFDKLP
ncbi:MAG: alpha-glucuronidase, partial [Prevotella sp.]|nr:alpha-glucuronidase [Prevotella sp.]